MIPPEENTIHLEVKLTTLFKDHGWKGHSEFSCRICGRRFSAPAWDEENETNNYRTAYPRLVEHITSAHPEFCYSCPKCDEKFISKKDTQGHLKSHKINKQDNSIVA